MSLFYIDEFECHTKTCQTNSWPFLILTTHSNVENDFVVWTKPLFIFAKHNNKLNTIIIVAWFSKAYLLPFAIVSFCIFV
jgi:hypothetical protein